MQVAVYAGVPAAVSALAVADAGARADYAVQRATRQLSRRRCRSMTSTRSVKSRSPRPIDFAQHEHLRDVAGDRRGDGDVARHVEEQPGVLGREFERELGGRPRSLMPSTMRSMKKFVGPGRPHHVDEDAQVDVVAGADRETFERHPRRGERHQAVHELADVAAARAVRGGSGLGRSCRAAGPTPLVGRRRHRRR